MLEVVGHVVAAEGKHGHWVEAQFANCTTGCCSGFTGHDGTKEYTVVPVHMRRLSLSFYNHLLWLISVHSLVGT